MIIQLYAGSQYYPLGGHKDFRGYFNSIDEAKKFADELFRDEVCVWVHMVCDGKIILEGNHDCLNDSKWEWEEL